MKSLMGVWRRVFVLCCRPWRDNSELLKLNVVGWRRWGVNEWRGGSDMSALDPAMSVGGLAQLHSTAQPRTVCGINVLLIILLQMSVSCLTVFLLFDLMRWHVHFSLLKCSITMHIRKPFVDSSEKWWEMTL